MKILLLRHGESEANVAMRISDDPSRIVNLTELGRVQAGVAADRLRSVPFTHAYVSEFPRARQTADIVLRDRGLSLHIDARLNERRSGMDGFPVDQFNDLVRSNPLSFKPEYGESFQEQMFRLRSFLDEVAERHPDGTVLAVSHENPIVAALALTVDDPMSVIRTGVKNCGWIEIDWI